jgi:hypothetical protein
MIRCGDVRIQLELARRTLGIALTLAALAAGTVQGQEMAMDQEMDATGEGFDLLAAVGILAPVADLTNNPDTYGTSMKVSIGFSADATFWFSRNFGIAATGVYASPDMQPRKLIPGEEEPDLGGATYLAGGLSAVYRLVGEGSRSAIEPYLALGGGIHHLKVDDEAAPELETRTDPAVTLAGGIRFEGISGIVMRVEARDFAYFFKSPATGDSRLQNDVYVTFAVGARVR